MSRALNGRVKKLFQACYAPTMARYAIFRLVLLRALLITDYAKNYQVCSLGPIMPKTVLAYIVGIIRVLKSRRNRVVRTFALTVLISEVLDSSPLPKQIANAHARAYFYFGSLLDFDIIQ